MHVFLGIVVIFTVLVGIVSKRMSPIVALAVAPFLAAVLGLGYSPTEASSFVVEGLRAIIPVTAMIIFAILFFGVVSDAGVMDPLIAKILKSVGFRPTRITLGTALLALIIHLDGSGAITILLTVPAMMPLYEHLGMDRRILACIIAMASGINFLPWTAPMLRASIVLNTSPTTIFMPLLPVQIAGLALMFYLSWRFGKSEEKRLGLTEAECNAPAPQYTLTEKQLTTRRPKLFWFNVILTLCVIFGMISHIVDAVVAFMLGLALALMVNYPDVQEQMKRLEAHARTALLLGSILLSAGAFVGIMQKTGMITAMAMALVNIIPQGMESHMPFLMAFFSVPISHFFDPDSFYFGVLPVVAESYRVLGGDPLLVGRAAVMGVFSTGYGTSPLTPSCFLLIGMTRLSLADHQRFTFPYLWLCGIFMTFVAAALGVFPW